MEKILEVTGNAMFGWTVEDTLGGMIVGKPCVTFPDYKSQWCPLEFQAGLAESFTAQSLDLGSIDLL